MEILMLSLSKHEDYFADDLISHRGKSRLRTRRQEAVREPFLSRARRSGAGGGGRQWRGQDLVAAPLGGLSVPCRGPCPGQDRNQRKRRRRRARPAGGLAGPSGWPQAAVDGSGAGFLLCAS